MHYSYKVSDSITCVLGINMVELKEKILSVIEKNSKISICDLAIVLGEKKENVATVIAEMEEDATIRGYHTIINWEKTNKERIVALIEVRVAPQRSSGFDHLAERIYNFPEVDSVYLMSGTFDFCVMLEGKTLRDVSRFISEKLSPLESVTGLSTHFVLKKYKEHGTVLVPDKKSERKLITL